jgi:tRNA pseudouridine55 synthase
MQAPFHGLLVADKPSGLTSRQVVDRAKQWFPHGTRIGHTGTLDPLATGILVLCVGLASRLTEYVQLMPKTYRAGLLLGARSDTDDTDGVIKSVEVGDGPERATVNARLQAFVGEIAQLPPKFSAAKVGGRRAYELARKGKEVALERRIVRIDRIELLAYNFPHLEMEVHCGKGTYIRSLARDLGDSLGCGALVESLRRTKVGPFTVDNAVRLDADMATVRSRLQPLAAALAELPALTLDGAQPAQLRQGRPVTVPIEAAGSGQHEVAVLDSDGGLVAVATFDPSSRLLAPVKVFPDLGGSGST